MAIPKNLLGDLGLFSNGKTPTHCAVERGNSELCKILLQYQNMSGKTFWSASLF